MLAVSTAELMGWLAFVAVVLLGASLVPLAAFVIRRRLPVERRETRSLPPLRLGQSPKTRRSPRHAVAAHRTFLAATIMTGISLVLIPFVGALRDLDLSGLLVAIAFAAPSLVVIVHSRRRDVRKRPGT
jgi:hypothetical protein